MKNLSRRVSAVTTAALALTFFAACNQADHSASEPGKNQNKLSVYLTDGPGRFDQVLVDVQGMAVKIDTSTAWWPHIKDGKSGHAFGHNWGNKDHQDAGAIWDTLDITPGIYNLLDFANGADTLLASGNITKGRIIAFRLTLGDNNSLVKDSVTYPLNLVPGWDKIYVRVFGANFQQVSNNHYKIWIDFDAGRSVIRLYNGDFYLKPVLHAFAVSNSGSLRGSVIPDKAEAVVSVYNDTDTAYAIPGRGGLFMVRGLAEGDYRVFVNASDGYSDTTITGIQVEAGKTADAGVIRLHE